MGDYPKCPKGHYIFRVHRLVLIDQSCGIDMDSGQLDLADDELGDVVDSNGWKGWCKECCHDYLIEEDEEGVLVVTKRVYRPSTGKRRF